VTLPPQVTRLLHSALSARATAATRCNERSSRSHCVFQLFITGSNSITGQTVEGTLNLIDLAGSERVSSSGATGDRFKETVQRPGTVTHAHPPVKLCNNWPVKLCNTFVAPGCHQLLPLVAV